MSARTGVAALTGLAALLRFSTLDRESLWFDEAVTVVDVLRPSFGATMEALSRADPTPPLYYALLWVWTQVFGTDEVGVRSLSALCGTLTVPVIYAAAAQLTASRRAGLATAAVVAVNPLLVWYSQETRAYALLTLVVALSLLAFARALEDPRPGTLALWAGAAALALLTHYFAVFLVAAEGLWLLAATRPRVGVLAAGAPLVVVGLGLGLLARHQAPTAGITWVHDLSSELRVREVPLRFVAGPRLGGVWGSALALGALLCSLPFLAGIVAGIRRQVGSVGGAPARRPMTDETHSSPDGFSERRLRRALAVASGLAAAVVLTPLLLAATGVLDVFFYRYVLPAALPLAVAIGALTVMARHGRRRIALLTALCLLFLVLDVSMVLTPSAHREDWRAAAAALGPPRGDRLLAVMPFFAREPLEFYGHRLAPPPPTPMPVSEVVIVGIVGLPPAQRLPAPAAPAGFERVPVDEPGGLSMVRFRATGDQLVTAADVAQQLDLDATYGVDSRPLR